MTRSSYGQVNPGKVLENFARTSVNVALTFRPIKDVPLCVFQQFPLLLIGRLQHVAPPSLLVSDRLAER